MHHEESWLEKEKLVKVERRWKKKEETVFPFGQFYISKTFYLWKYELKLNSTRGDIQHY